MSEWQPKRFWAKAQAVPVDGGHTVLLDGRRVRTPGKADLIVPTGRFAERIAAEWDAQVDVVDSASMPLTRSANAAIDRVGPQFDEVANMLAEYGAADLLCYRASEPAELRQRQEQAWGPLLEWAAEHLQAPLLPAHGVMFRAQPDCSLANLRGHVIRLGRFQLAAFHDLVGLSGSLILAFAVIHGRIGAADAWPASRIDEDWQSEQWGADAEAGAVAARRKEQFLLAAEIFDLLSRE